MERQIVIMSRNPRTGEDIYTRIRNFYGNDIKGITMVLYDGFKWLDGNNGEILKVSDSLLFHKNYYTREDDYKIARSLDEKTNKIFESLNIPILIYYDTRKGLFELDLNEAKPKMLKRIELLNRTGNLEEEKFPDFDLDDFD